MPRLAFVVPVHGRAKLTRICLQQLRRTCDALTADGVDATAVIVGDDANLSTARRLGFATVRRNNEFLSAKFNDGIQAALDPRLTDPPLTVGRYKVGPRRRYRGHQPGAVFHARIEPAAVQRAVNRGDITLVEREPVTFDPAAFTPAAGWDGKPADYVVPCGSDDWVDHRLFLSLPAHGVMVGFRHIAFVREDGQQITSSVVNYRGGCGIRIYPRALMGLCHYRPADEDRTRACDTSILVNVERAYRARHDRDLLIAYRDLHPRQIVDWKSPAEQINSYAGVRQYAKAVGDDPFTALADTFPQKSLAAMRAHYGTPALVAA